MESEVVDKYNYPNDGRADMRYPGIWNHIAADLPGQPVVELNSSFDSWINKHVIDNPWSPLNLILQLFFGVRGEHENIEI